MKVKLDIFIAAKNKSGDVVFNRKTQIRAHECDIVISHQHTPGSFCVEKNRYSNTIKLKHGSTSIGQVISLGSTMPRKKKKAFKKMLLSI